LIALSYEAANDTHRTPGSPLHSGKSGDIVHCARGTEFGDGRDLNSDTQPERFVFVTQILVVS
jgi:hypothetical protein